jgi:hypothetical protein
MDASPMLPATEGQDMGEAPLPRNADAAADCRLTGRARELRSLLPAIAARGYETHMSTRQLLAALVIVLISVPLVAAPTTTQPSHVGEGDQIQFQQKTAAAQMQELQERMYRLAELIRDAEPTDSAKLLMGVQKAREELILEQMNTITELLARKDLKIAADQQKEVILKLEELKRLLASGDMDLAMQLERLKKLSRAIEKLDAVIKEEQKQQAASGEIAKQQQERKPVDEKKFDGAKQEQQQTRKNAEAVAQMVKSLGEGGAKAAGGLGEACQSMSSAEGALGGKKAGEAQQQQDQAVQALKKAREELAKERERLLKEIERQTRKQVIANLVQMLETEVAVREATEALSTSAASGHRESVLRAKQLAPTQQKVADVCEETIELIELTQFSVALPPALASIQRRAIYVATDLRAGRAGEPVVAAERQIERDLSDLIDTMREAAASASQGNSQCKSCGGSKNKLLAELKVLRLLQLRVNEETKDADGRCAQAEAEMPPDLREKIGTIRENQDEVHKTTDKLHHATCPDCVAGTH